MIAGLLALLGSSTVGSLVGGALAWLNKRSDVDVKRLELAHEQAKWQHELLLRDKDIAYAQTEAAAKVEVAHEEADGLAEAARMHAIGVVQSADSIGAAEIKAAGRWGWVLVAADVSRRVIRPFVTILLLGVALYINWLLIYRLTQTWDTMTVEQQYDAGMQAFAWVTCQASVVISYWFVARGSAPRT